MTEEYRVSQKKEIPKLDIDVLMGRIGIEIYLEIFREQAMPIVNIETFEGLETDEDLLCFGFTESGEPITTIEEFSRIKYVIYGSKSSQGFITPNFGRGRRCNDVVVKGWDAIASYCKCSPEYCKEQIQKLCDMGIQKRIYVRRVCNLVGLSDDFGLFKNPTVFSGEDWIRHNIDYNSVWNKMLLPKLKSKWRILTSEIRSGLEAKRAKALGEAYGNEFQ